MVMDCQVVEGPDVLSEEISSFEQRLRAGTAITLDELRELERRVSPFRRGPHYQLAQRVRKIAIRLGHLDAIQWERLRQAPAPVFILGERSYIGRLESTKGAPVEVKVVYDHLFLTTNHRASVGASDLVKITHRFNREGRLDLVDARLKQTSRLLEEPGAPEAQPDSIFHLVQAFAFKDKVDPPEWTESRCEYFIRLRQIVAVFAELGLRQGEQHYRHLIQAGHRLMRELKRDLDSSLLKDIRTVRPPFFPFTDLRSDEPAGYIIGRAASLEPRVTFDPRVTGGHLGDLRIRYTAA
jgi:hypothetical protein